MAWEFVRELNINGNKIQFNVPTSFNVVLPNIPSPLNSNSWNEDVFLSNDNINNYNIAPSPFQAQKNSYQGDTTYTIGSSSNSTLRIYYSGDSNNYQFKQDSTTINNINNMINNSNGGYCLVPLINHETQQGVFAYLKTAYYFASDAKISLNISGTYTNYGIGYQILTGAIPVLYNWQSVPSIIGKNGILSLAQIKEEYINDGESVSGVSADHFTNLSTENRVDVLIDDALPAPEIVGTTVTVKYTISSLSIGSYAYCKLVAKKNSIPESPEDGDKIINIDPSLTSIVVRGLDELSTYYFVIFIEDDQGNTASSEPKSCKTGAILLRTILDSENDVVDTCLDNIVNYKDCGVDWGKFTESSKTIFGNSGNYCTCSGAISQYFKKKNATKVYIDIEATNPQSQSKLRLAVLKEGYPQWVDFFDDEATYYYKVILINQGWKSLERQVIEMPLTSVPSDAKFRLGFFRADVTVKIRKIYFDDDVIVVQE